MNAGDLRKRITLQVLSDKTTNENGFPLPEDERYQDHVTIWAAVYPLKGSEFWTAKTTYNKNVVKFICRYIPGVNADMQIKYNNRIFDIIGVIDVDERHKWLQIMGEEVV
ncbi:phage head-tail adaptor [Desulfitobacterium hafniense DCB-2]|uniref:Phage head-tail adaptor n=1 Tax=Desulfitobacterium hafniense (strain DSM 10664 / DCB-2) TaxID=272564 RepID=B8FNY9_DESHD|nr:phage head closure protein [Desulfitobacterium hafniense]ACL19514.1 phage head-tail adaptor [Desulfitobacterium hafniense DCB-2]